MARIFERPRYLNQARNKLISLVCASESTKLIRRMISSLSLDEKEAKEVMVDYQHITDLIQEDIYSDENMPDVHQPLESYLLESSISKSLNKSKLFSQDSAYTIAKDFLDTFDKRKPSRVICDIEAIFYLIHKFLEDDKIYQEGSLSKKARNLSSNLIFLQLMPQKIAPGLWNKVFKKSKIHSGTSEFCNKAMAWLQAFENAQYRAHPMWVKYCRIWAMKWQRMKGGLERMIDKVKKSNCEERFTFESFEKCMPDCKSYNYSGVIVTYVNDVCLVYDNSAADFGRTCMASFRNADIAFNDFRLTGDVVDYDTYTPFQRVLSWMKENMANTKQAQYLARHMHLSYIAWQNLVGEKDAKFDCGATSRHESLKKEILEVFPKNLELFNMINSFKVPERVKCEYFKLYHLLPPPDIDQVLLHEQLIEKSLNTNSCDESTINEFINFCKAYDFCRVATKEKSIPSHLADTGYDIYDKKWLTSCVGGKFSMPPEEEWGKVKLHKHFPYDHSSDFHIFDAKDVTRVVSNLDYYMSRCKTDKKDPIISNELLNAIFNGPKLSNGMTMSEWRDKVMEGRLDSSDECIAAEAGKSENTKPGKKVRETLSGSDNVREFLTEIDHSLRPLASLTPGVSIRMDAVKHKRKFQTMAHSISKYSSKLCFATSTDISGWSPNMPRKMFHAWQRYALSTTQCKNPSAVEQIWSRLVAFCDRRGVKRSDPFTDGTFQGWPATSDTVMHAHILIFWAYKLKESKLLSSREAAYTLCLIDDAATVVVLEGAPSEAQKRAEQAKKMLADIYSKLGFVMDEIKSYFSSVKFVYLNELYLDGAQVMHSIKTMMRIDKDHTRRFASLTDHIATAFGTAASAANQGGCPFMCYYIAAWISYQEILRLNSDLTTLDDFDIFLISIAPVGMNGFGMKLMSSVFATGQNDELTWFLEVIEQYIGFKADHSLAVFLNMNPDQPSPSGAFRNPYHYCVEGHKNASSIIMKKFREVAREKGLAEPFLSLDKYTSNVDYEKAIKVMLDSGAYEAGLLEEVSSCMPEAFIDELMARIERTELIATLLSSKNIGSLRRIVRSVDLSNILNVVQEFRRKKFSNTENLYRLKELGVFEYAKEMKSRRFANYQILNNVYPCPFSLWAFEKEVDLNDESAQKRTTLSFNYHSLHITSGSDSHNLYDSIPFNIGYKGYKSVQNNIENEVRVLFYNPVRRKIAQGLAALRWARESGVHYVALTDLFLHSWSGHTDIRLLDLHGLRSDVSVKRLSLRHKKMNHLISMFPNTQACVRVNAKAITRIQAGTHHMYDLMSAITTLRASGLLESALKIKTKVNSFAYSFLYKASSSAIIEVPNRDENYFKNEYLHKVTPFVDIASPLQNDAKVALSYDKMVECLELYVNVSEKACAEYFEDLKDEIEIDYEDWAAHEVIVERVKVLERARNFGEIEKSKTIFLGQTLPKPKRPAIVQTDDSQVQRPDTSILSSLTEREGIYIYCNQLNDNLALQLCKKFPYLANLIEYNTAIDDVEKIYEDDEFVNNVESFKIHEHELRKMFAILSESSPGMNIRDMAFEFMHQLGMRGFQLVDDNEDVYHSMASFLCSQLGIYQRLQVIAKSIRKFHPEDEADYEARKILGSTLPGYSIGDVIIATWRLAAARYENKSRTLAMMKDPSQAKKITSLNYKSVMLKSFAFSVSTTGNVRYKEAFNIIVDKVYHSITSHIKGIPKRKEYTDLVLAENLTLDIDSELDMKEAITGIVELAKPFSDDIDIGVIFAAYDEVVGWVKADTMAVCERTVPISKFRKTKLAVAKAPVPVSVQEVAVTPAAVIEPPKENPYANLMALSNSMVTVTEKGEIILPSVMVIPSAPLSSEFNYSSPHDVMQWVSDNHDIMKKMISIGYSKNEYVMYDDITRSKSVWEKFKLDLGTVCDLQTFRAPEWSKFEAKYMEDLEMDANWVHE